MATNERDQRAAALIGKVFVPSFPGTPGGFMYVRDVGEGTVSLSVMEYYTEKPVFDGRAVFTIPEEIFNVMFKPVDPADEIYCAGMKIPDYRFGMHDEAGNYWEYVPGYGFYRHAAGNLREYAPIGLS